MEFGPYLDRSRGPSHFRPLGRTLLASALAGVLSMVSRRSPLGASFGIASRGKREGSPEFTRFMLSNGMALSTQLQVVKPSTTPGFPVFAKGLDHIFYLREHPSVAIPAGDRDTVAHMRGVESERLGCIPA